MPNSAVPITPGTGVNIDTVTMPNGDHRQRVIIGDFGGYQGRAAAFRAVGRAAGTRQTLLTLWNPTGTGINCNVKALTADVFQTAAKAATVLRPVVRVYKITAAPTGGTVLTKVSLDTSETPNASVVVTGDASADGTNSATALTFTTNAGAISQEYAPQMITLAGYEMADRIEFLEGDVITCRPGEGVALALDYAAAASNPATDHWIASIRWEEYVE